MNDAFISVSIVLGVIGTVLFFFTTLGILWFEGASSKRFKVSLALLVGSFLFLWAVASIPASQA